MSLANEIPKVTKVAQWQPEQASPNVIAVSVGTSNEI